MFWLVTLAVLLLGMIGLTATHDGKAFFQILILSAVGLAIFKIWRSRKEKLWYSLSSQREGSAGHLFLLYSKICRAESRHCAQDPPNPRMGRNT